MDTIFAVSSGAPPAAIAVLRISGPAAFEAGARLAGSLPPPRHAAVRILRDPGHGGVLDRALVLVFPGPATATGEDLVELHLHGGRAVVAAVENALRAMAGLRPALPGEFTRRALASGRIDLTEAEGLGDLLSAETEGQRRAAMMAAEGGIRRRIGQWTGRVLSLSARVEAELDFSDEADVAAEQVAGIAREIAVLAEELAAVLAAPPVERLHHGIRVVLAGPPNSGKSTLLNALVDREAAIVSPVAGTTRDRIEAAVRRDGVAYVFTDTAGLRADSDDPIERIGMSRAYSAMEMADIILWLGDDDAPEGAIALYPRVDQQERKADAQARGLLAVSAATGFGMAELWAALAERATALLPRADEIALNARQRELLAEALGGLQAASTGLDLLLVAEDLRVARHALDRITGVSGTDAMLDALFGKFCIGK